MLCSLCQHILFCIFFDIKVTLKNLWWNNKHFMNDFAFSIHKVSFDVCVRGGM